MYTWRARAKQLSHYVSCFLLLFLVSFVQLFFLFSHPSCHSTHQTRNETENKEEEAAKVDSIGFHFGCASSWKRKRGKKNYATVSICSLNLHFIVCAMCKISCTNMYQMEVERNWLVVFFSCFHHSRIAHTCSTPDSYTYTCTDIAHIICV